VSTTTSAAPHPLGTQTIHHHRIVSLDILRGLNIALMIFVNELAEVKGLLPWWTYHAPAKST
jgi:heparan-alpha-glucosaminide N-acetyltransferase